MKLLDQLAQQYRRPDYMTGAVAVVTAVNLSAGGTTVDINLVGESVAGIPCSAAYPVPVEGDVVWIVKTGSAWHVAYSLGKPAAAGSANLVPNPGFELDPVGIAQPSGWSAFVRNAGPPQIITADSHSGQRAWRVDMQATKDRYLVMTEAAAIPGGSQLRAGVWVKQSKAFLQGETLALELWVGDEAGVPDFNAQRITIGNPSSPPGQWKYFELPVVMPATRSWARLVLFVGSFNATVSAGASVTWDDPLLRIVT